MASSVPLTILVHEWVTGGGLAGSTVPPSWAAEGLAMRRSIAADFAALPGPGARVMVTVDARWPDDHGPWTTVRMAEGNFHNSLLDVARQADYTVLIAPETMGVLARLALGLENAGARSLGCSARSMELTGNKARLADWLLARGIATPAYRIIVPAEGLPPDARYPAVIKPVDGAGSVDTFWAADAADLPAAARAMPVALLQPFHDGIPMSASFLVAEDQDWLIAIGRQRTRIRGGRFVYQGGSIPVPCLQAEPPLLRAVESVPGLRGFVGVDFLWDPDPGEITVLEINPRPTTSFVGLSCLLPSGHLAGAWLAACGVPGYPRDLLADLADLVRRQPRLCFDADGTIRPVAHEAVIS
jgi:predicted ATP-grasp superfamily ATP-dependent carboligase